MHVYGELTGVLTAGATISGSLISPQTLQGTLTVPSAVNVTLYDGDYEFTPSTSPQIIGIEDKMAVQDIVINPIPNNYGLITWDGTKITVS